MTELENTVRRYRFQMIFMSITLLLIGLGGWISLMAAQSYRISQEALNRVQAFTGLLISRLPVGVIATDHPAETEIPQPHLVNRLRPRQAEQRASLQDAHRAR